MIISSRIVRKQRRVITDPQEKHVRLFLESMKISTGKPTVKIGYKPTGGKFRFPVEKEVTRVVQAQKMDLERDVVGYIPRINAAEVIFWRKPIARNAC